MNFLNKAKEQANNFLNNKGGSPMGNPFLNKNTVNNQTVPTAPVAPVTPPSGIPAAPKAPAAPAPGMKPPAIPGKPAVPPMPGKPGVPPVPGKPANPFAKTETVAAPAPKTANDTTKEVESKVETPVAETEVKVEVPAVEVETKKEETTEAVKEAVEETTKTEEKKTTTKKKGGSRTSKAKATKVAEEIKDAPTVSQDAVEVIVSHTTLSYAEACQSIRTHFVDEEWEADMARFEEMSRNIHISSDMNKAQLHDLLAQVSNLRDEMHSAYTQTRTLYEHLTDKDNGMIERTKRTGAKGSNSEERKLTSTLAVMNYVDENGNKINLYEVLDETRIRYNCLKGLMDTIEFKKGVLLTMLSSLKSN